MGTDTGENRGIIRENVRVYSEKINLAITGANGFIGTCLINELLKLDKYVIKALVRDESKAVEISKADNVFVLKTDYEKTDYEKELKDVDVCIYLIGQMGKYGVSEKQFIDVNVKLTEKVLQSCILNGVKQFIFCSTPGVQGFGTRLADEGQRYAPRNIYEKTKVMAEESVIRLCNDTNMNYTIIRPDFVYGPGDVRRVKMYKNIKNGKFILTTNGKSYLHPTYITDVAQGFIKSILNPNAYNQVFNISAEQDVTSLEYLNTIANCVGSKLVHINIGYKLSIMAAGLIDKIYKLRDKEAFVDKNKIDFLALDHSTSNKKAKSMIEYRPQVSIEEGMKKTIEWCVSKNLL